MFLVVGIAMALSLAGCSLLLTADQEQCSVNADCAVGVCYDGLCRVDSLAAPCDTDDQCGDYRCLSGFCRDIGPEWSCHRRYEAIQPTSSESFEVSLYNFFDEPLPTGGQAKLCDTTDPTCSSPLSMVDNALNAEGEVSFLLPPNRQVYMDLELESLRPQLVSPGLTANALALSDGNIIRFPLFYGSDELLQELATRNTIDIPPAGSHGILWLNNCRDFFDGFMPGTSYEGVRIELSAVASDTKILYFNNDLVGSRDRTNSEGYVGVVNLPPGAFTATAYIDVDGQEVEVAQGTFVSRPGYFTWGMLWPQSREAP